MFPTKLGDRLKVSVYTFKALTIQVSGLVKHHSGEIRSFGPEIFVVDGVTLSTTIDGAENYKIIPALIDGELLALNVTTDTLDLMDGEAYVKASVLTQGLSTPRAVLFAGYISSSSPLSHPGSEVKNSLSGSGVYKTADLVNDEEFTVPLNTAIKILNIYAYTLATEPGDVVFGCLISPKSGYTSYEYVKTLSVDDIEDYPTVNYFLGCGGSQDGVYANIPIPDSVMTANGGLTIAISGVNDTGEDVIQIGYLQWIYPSDMPVIPV